MDITAFMNLMVILVPFLLITAVFSRITILELNLPAAGGAAADERAALDLEVVVRKSAVEVANRGALLRRVERSGEQHDLRSLSQVLSEIKTRYPDKTNATILMEPDISYDTLVQVMDAVRALEGAKGVPVELFPDISVGDAPLGAAPAVAPTPSKTKGKGR